MAGLVPAISIKRRRAFPIEIAGSRPAMTTMGASALFLDRRVGGNHAMVPITEVSQLNWGRPSRCSSPLDWTRPRVTLITIRLVSMD
jgi:hypothetical protein